MGQLMAHMGTTAKGGIAGYLTLSPAGWLWSRIASAHLDLL